MIEAEIKHKVPEIADSEDCLTSTVFGLLKYFPMRQILAIFLGKAIGYHNNAIRLDSSMCQGRKFLDKELEIRFWEKFPGFGEPDVLLSGKDYAIVVEVKLNAELSGRDQLRKYYAMLKYVYQEKMHKHIIYLTKDLTPPLLDGEVIDGMEGHLWWLSWYELYQILFEKIECDPVSQEMANDLKRYIDHRGLFLFQGFHIPSIDSQDILFWNDTSPLMTPCDSWPEGSRVFWKDKFQ